jgi:cyclic pyranopterin phosphate synthase
MKANIIKFGKSPEAGPLDRHQRSLHDLRISVMDRCNFRCPYCMPEEKFRKGFKFLRRHERLSFDEIIRIAQVFRRLGDKIEMYYIGG